MTTVEVIANIRAQYNIRVLNSGFFFHPLEIYFGTSDDVFYGLMHSMKLHMRVSFYYNAVLPCLRIL